MLLLFAVEVIRNIHFVIFLKHSHGYVHRDIKSDNILIMLSEGDVIERAGSLVTWVFGLVCAFLLVDFPCAR